MRRDVRRLNVEVVLDGGMNGQTAARTDKKRWADPGDLKRCILRSRRRVG